MGTTAVASGVAACEIIGSSTKRTVVLVVDIKLATNTANVVLGLGRPAAAGITPGGLVTVVGEDPSDDGDTQLALSWGTGPTVPSKFLKRIAIGTPATAVAPIGISWRFPQGLLLETSGANRSLVLWNIAGVAGMVFDVNVTVEED